MILTDCVTCMTETYTSYFSDEHSSRSDSKRNLKRRKGKCTNMFQQKVDGIP